MAVAAVVSIAHVAAMTADELKKELTRYDAPRTGVKAAMAARLTLLVCFF